MNKLYISQINIIRFAAAVWIVVFHQSGPTALLGQVLSKAPDFIFNIVRTGYVGVNIFFLISGFVLSYNYIENADSLKKRSFFVARFARIYPVYLLGWLVAAPFVVRNAFTSGDLSSQPGKIMIDGLSSLLLLHAWLPNSALSWNAPSWAISCEFFFYLSFPFFAILVNKLKPSKLLLGIIAMWLLSLLVPSITALVSLDWIGRLPARGMPFNQFVNLPATELPMGLWPQLIKFNPILRLPEFLIGIMLGRLFLLRRDFAVRIPRAVVYGSLFLGGLSLIVVFCGIMSRIIYYPIFHNGFLSIFIAIMLYGVASDNGFFKKLLEAPFLVRLGDLSYALFVLHYPVYSWMYWLDTHSVNLTKTNPFLHFFLYLAVTITLSTLTFYLIEEPSRKFIRRTLQSETVNS